MFKMLLKNKITFKVHAHQKEEKEIANVFDDVFNITVTFNLRSEMNGAMVVVAQAKSS